MAYSVLIVEDDPSYQHIISTFVTGFPELKTVGIVSDSVEAALAITRHHPDIVFLDIQIPGLNGLEVLETLDYEPVTLVISGNPQFKVDTLDFKIIDFIEKPISNPAILKAAIRKCIQACSK